MSFRCICRQHLILVLLLLSVGVCKVAVFCTVYRTDPTRILTPDSLSYNNTAKAFLETGHFAISSDRPDIPQTVRTPGYPFFIATIYAFLDDNHEQSGPLKAFFQIPFDIYIQKWGIERTGLLLLFLLAEGYLLLLYASITYTLGQLVQIQDRSWHLFMWIFITSFVIVSISGGPEAYSRFQIPIMPLLCVYAGHGIYQIFTRFTRAKHY